MESAPAARTGCDHLFVVSVLLLTGLGLVTLWTASANIAGKIFNGNNAYIAARQALLALAAMVVFLVMSRIRMQMLRRLVPLLVLSSIVLCVLTFIPGISMEKNGASRWIRVGSLSLQPSEMVKIALPLYLAHIFDKKRDRLDSFAAGVLPPAIMTVVFFILIYAQNNFSDAVFVAANALIIFCVSGVRLRYFISAAGILVPVSFLLILTREYRLLRVMSFLWPTDPLGADYQVRASVLTINSGGFWGKGVGQSARAVASVPEVHSDFIFAAFCEEAGFLGILLFYMLMILFACRGYRAALRAEDNFSAVLCFGYVTLIVSQTLLNIAVVSGSIPATGVPLPFFSAGGSSMVSTLVAAGVIANVSRRAGGAL
ncbi:MAG: FtsW/RodA/SpoVE family cell cycle protein [Spirochaetaceae bacterium]|jgi:cell division protein FtsW|nr:FtsW/RodA/SpoVE family cell cycle protein [Spirochaetaceae bacterium]